MLFRRSVSGTPLSSPSPRALAARCPRRAQSSRTGQSSQHNVSVCTTGPVWLSILFRPSRNRIALKFVWPCCCQVPWHQDGEYCELALPRGWPRAGVHGGRQRLWHRRWGGIIAATWHRRRAPGPGRCPNAPTAWRGCKLERIETQLSPIALAAVTHISIAALPGPIRPLATCTAWLAVDDTTVARRHASPVSDTILPSQLRSARASDPRSKRYARSLHVQACF